MILYCIRATNGEVFVYRVFAGAAIKIADRLMRYMCLPHGIPDGVVATVCCRQRCALGLVYSLKAGYSVHEGKGKGSSSFKPTLFS